MLPDYQPIFRKYNQQLKPLISEIEGRLERFSQPLLLNLASVYDYMSIAAADNKHAENCLKSSDDYLNLCLSQSYMSLIYAIMQNTDSFEKSLGKNGLRKLNNGHFIGKYEKLKKSRDSLLKKAKKMDETEALPLFKDAYEVATKMEKMLNGENANMSLIQKEISSWETIGMRWLLSIIISIAASILVNHYFG